MGAYHGFDGFTTFSKKKGVLLQNPLVGTFLSGALKPPYTPSKIGSLRSC
jgi:coniferyl-aldehyde dehydrogenase